MDLDVCVVGAGPAGSTAARRLAQLGYNVGIVEREIFPRPAVGESLPASILPLLDILGIREHVEKAAFPRPTAAIVRWGTREEQRREQPGPPGFQVDRARFDAILLDAAREAGAHLLQPAHAGGPIRRDGARWVVNIRHAGISASLSADVLIVATGRRGWSTIRRTRASPPTLALYGYWWRTGIEGMETRVEAGEDCWVWCAPLANGIVAAAAFVDAKRDVVRSTKLKDLYRDLLERHSLVRNCLDGFLVDQVQACDASILHASDPVKDQLIIAGDCGFAMDPLSSQGVQSAIGSGLRAAVAANTILARPPSRNLAEQFLRERFDENIAHHRDACAAFYAEIASTREHPFWRKRAETPRSIASRHHTPRNARVPLSSVDRIRLSPDTRVVQIPSIDGDFICSNPGIDHPALKAPLTFLGGISVKSLVDEIRAGQTIDELLRAWSTHVRPGYSAELLAWFWNNDIIEAEN